MRPLLTRAVPRSEHDADLEAAAANLTMGMHRVTGAFEDPSHESAFAAQLFRQAYLVHILLMGFTTVHYADRTANEEADRRNAGDVTLQWEGTEGRRGGDDMAETTTKLPVQAVVTSQNVTDSAGTQILISGRVSFLQK